MAEELSGFRFPIEHLENLISQMEKGIEPMMTDLEKLEVKRLYKMKTEELFDDDEPLSAEEEEYRQKLVKNSIEEAKRKAHKQDVKIIKLSEAQMKQLEEDMSSSLVRPNPNTLYNKSDDELYKSAEERIMNDKLKKLRNCYYDADEWVSKIQLIWEAVALELKSDRYAYLGNYQNRVNAFNEGRIVLNIQIPKLYLNRVTPITDPELLMGIMKGEVKVVDRASESDIKKKSYRNSELVSMYVPTISDAEHDYYSIMHKKGYETPESGAIIAKSTISNRYVPSSEKKSKGFGILDEKGVPIQYDWLNEGAQEYYRRLHGLHTTIDDIVENLQRNNNGKINKVLADRMNKFVSTYNRGGVEEVKPDWLSSSLQVSPSVVKMEQELLQAIQLNNPE